jgi:hypothetical protein
MRYAKKEPVTLDHRQMCPVMTLEDARRVLRVRKAEIYELIDAGVLKTFSRGTKARYVTDEALRATIRHLEKAGTAA